MIRESHRGREKVDSGVDLPGFVFRRVAEHLVDRAQGCRADEEARPLQTQTTIYTVSPLRIRHAPCLVQIDTEANACLHIGYLDLPECYGHDTEPTV